MASDSALAAFQNAQAEFLQQYQTLAEAYKYQENEILRLNESINTTDRKYKELEQSSVSSPQ